jgi:hypothetical protein
MFTTEGAVEVLFGGKGLKLLGNTYFRGFEELK